MLAVVHGYEMEVLDENMMAVVELDDTVTPPPQLMCLSYNSFVGIISPTTTMLRGAIGNHEIVVMLDSGASHNFITLDMVAKTKSPITRDMPLQVMLGTGITAQGFGVCKKVCFTVQGVDFVSDFVILELGNADIILGVAWHKTLGECKANWETHELSFDHHGKWVTLTGELDLHGTKMSFQSSTSTSATPNQLAALNSSCKELQIPAPLVSVLAKFASVFDTLTALPPVREREHAIKLLPLAGPISVRPYRYPLAHKAAMEKLVQEMLDAGIIRISLFQDVQKYVAECQICQTHNYSTLSPAGLFHEVVRLHGYPVSIVFDRDRIFLRRFWKECFKQAGTKLKYITSFHPQRDGRTEATPFQVVYGRASPAIVRNEGNSPTNVELEAHRRSRDRMLTQIKEDLVRAQQLMKDNADKSRRDVQFEVGNMVYFKLLPFNSLSLKLVAYMLLRVYWKVW